MERAISLISFNANHQLQVRFLMLVISLVYLFNFHVNDIWTPNESFYAEAVREMFESGNFIEFFYNYEPRYKKPPLTYWAIAGSVAIFGISEFAIRLPIVLMGILTVWFSYLLGKKLYGEKAGIYSMVMMAVSLQFLSVKQYASPEVPLTLFFTASMFYFIKAYMEKNRTSLYLSYLMLGLAVLAKGFPYLIIAAGIIGLFLLIENWKNWKGLLNNIKFLKLHLGLPIVLIIGLSWIIFMYLKDGSAFWEVYYTETFGRALSKPTRGPQPFFYVEVISWSIIPYSLAFFYALIIAFKSQKNFKEVSFAFSWFITMFVIFTISKGKIPTYIIQAHPAMLLMIVPLLISLNPVKKISKTFWAFLFLFPGFLIVIGTIAIIQILHLNIALYLIPTLVIFLAVLLYNQTFTKKNSKLVAWPFWAMVGFMIVFGSFFPKIEDYRPYDEIGKKLENRDDINDKTPLIIHETLIHNMPFYAKRKVIDYQTTEFIQKSEGPTLALVKNSILNEFADFETVWSGLIYDFSSESQFFKFVMAVKKAEDGDLSKFAPYSLIYKE